MPLADVDTPALILELDDFERNLGRLAAAAASRGVRLRPHGKSHKCPAIAHQQMAAGARGICCQKVGEAEAMVDGGLKDILLSNEIVGAPKLARLAALATRARISVCVDAPGNIADLEAAARQADARIEVLVEINVGSNRCGVEPGEPALALARQIASCSHLRFAGLQAYHGPAQHFRPVAERAAAIVRAAAEARRTRTLLEENGIACGVVTGGGTGTYVFEAASGIYNEIQPGSYLFMDADYARNEWDAAFIPFGQSLFVWTTLMSRPGESWGAVDAGMKAVSVDSGMPIVHQLSGVKYIRAADEHGVLSFDEKARHLAVGAKLLLVPGHCDPTVNLHDWFVGIRRGKVEVLWPITARGAFF